MRMLWPPRTRATFSSDWATIATGQLPRSLLQPIQARIPSGSELQRIAEAMCCSVVQPRMLGPDCHPTYLQAHYRKYRTILQTSVVDKCCKVPDSTCILRPRYNLCHVTAGAFSMANDNFRNERPYMWWRNYAQCIQCQGMQPETFAPGRIAELRMRVVSSVR
jgi:hypothetical protein